MFGRLNSFINIGESFSLRLEKDQITGETGTVKQKIEQLNQSYKKALGAVILREFAGEGIVVEDVLLDPSMQHGRVWLVGSAEQLQQVIAKRGRLQRLVQNHLKTRYTPIIEFLPSDHYLEKIDQLINEVAHED